MKIAAMNAKIGKLEDLDNPNLIFEPKLDGYRAICYVNKDVNFISRNNLVLNYPGLDIRKNIKAEHCILDGEIVAYNEAGNPDFQLLQNGYVSAYIVFDVLAIENKSLINLPLIERKKILEKLIKPSKKLEIIPFTTNGHFLYELAKKSHLEGVMAKKINGLYYPGKRTSEWLKIKFVKTADCVIIGYIVKKRIVSSLALAVYDHEKLRYIGNVGTGFSQDDLEAIFSKLQKLSTDKSVIPNVKISGIHWVKPKLVCEVKFQNVTKDGSLRAPVFIRLRTDKKPKDCTFKDQLE